MLCAAPLGVTAQGVAEVVAALRNVACYQAKVDYQVLMSLQNDVQYTVSLRSQAAPTDTLAPCSYLISWSIGEEADSVTGFCAYAGGDMYQFRGQRLQEHHVAQNPRVFMASGSAASPLPGVQMRGQFTNLLPQFIANEIEQATADSRYSWKLTPDTTVSGERCKLFEAKMIIDGTVCKELTYGFDQTNGMPLFSETENNPGALAEQTIVCRYTTKTDKDGCRPIDEPMLAEMFPNAFDLYRESTFTISKLPSQPLPAITLPTTTGERYTRHRGDRFARPTLVVLLSATTGFARQTVDEVRRAVSSLPDNVDIIWAFTDNNADDIESIIARPEPGEHLLQSARALARDCGVSVLPVVIYTDTDGIVRDVTVGFNKTLGSDVIEKAIHLK